MKMIDVVMIAAIGASALLLTTDDARSQTQPQDGGHAQTADGKADEQPRDGAAETGAQDLVHVPLPDLSGLDDAQASDLAHQVAGADVFTSNCPGFAISGGAFTLLSGTADLLEQRLNLTPADYQRSYLEPAYALLDDPATCEREGPKADPLIARLIAMGGATTPLTTAAPKTTPAPN